MYGLATGASALATSLGVLLVFRFLVGLGLGAELPVASTLISEFSPRAIRGRVVVALEAFWALGWILAALIGTFIVPQANGWRWALAIGLIPAIYSLVIRMGTPESVRFLESVGKHDQARQIVERFEASPALFSRTNKKQTEDTSVHGAAESADKMCIRDRYKMVLPLDAQTREELVERSDARTLPENLRMRTFTGADEFPWPVSYTHLDVYKRQAYFRRRLPRPERCHPRRRAQRCQEVRLRIRRFS